MPIQDIISIDEELNKEKNWSKLNINHVGKNKINQTVHNLVKIVVFFGFLFDEKMNINTISLLKPNSLFIKKSLKFNCPHDR